MKKIYIGIDNGVSGTIGIITPTETAFFKTPVKKVLKYTKKKANVSRIDLPKLKAKLLEYLGSTDVMDNPESVIISLERPMVNPKRFQASASALRAWEALLICMEDLDFPYDYIDSKEWQKKLLPSGVKGGADLKKASRQVGERLFPQFKEIKHEDMDGILIAEYLRRTYQNA